jgi:two-component system, response regulator YesN
MLELKKYRMGGNTLYKMIVVDDNHRDRKGIQGLIEWSKLGIEIIGCYANGAVCLENMDALSADIVLTDVMMPVMNGIELAENIKAKYPHVRVLFMSAYNEFDFAKSALDLDACGYVLKPIVKEEIIKAVSKIVEGLEEENNSKKEKQALLERFEKVLPSYREQFFRELLFGEFREYENIDSFIRLFKLNIPKEFYIQVVSFHIEQSPYIDDTRDITGNFLTTLSLQNIFHAYNNESAFTYLLKMNSFTYTSVIISSNDSVIDLIAQIKEELTEKYGFKTSFGLSKTGRSYQEMSELYNQSVKAMNTKFYSSSESFVLYEEIEDDNEELFEGKISFDVLYGEIKNIISCGTEAEIHSFIGKYLNSSCIVKREAYVKSFTVSVITIVEIILNEANADVDRISPNQLALWVKLNKYNNIQEIISMLTEVLKQAINTLVAGSGSGYSQIVEDIKDIVKQRYSDKISVDDIAGFINFSPTHANNIFKKITGETIFEYLTNYRMERAKEMLRDPYSKIYIVAEKVGYTNKSHFCLKFKQYTGLAPTDYKNNPGA